MALTLTLDVMDDVTFSPPPVSTDEDISDEMLMGAYVAGDLAAFEALYSRHRVKLYRYLLRHLKNPATADELFQDVWQRVISAQQQWKSDASFSAWLYRIAHNRMMDHWRAQKHRPHAPDNAEEFIAELADTFTPEDQASAQQQRSAIETAIAALPQDQREVIMLRLEQELTLEQIGELTGASRETVKSRLRYAMNKLRERLGG